MGPQRRRSLICVRHRLNPHRAAADWWLAREVLQGRVRSTDLDWRMGLAGPGGPGDPCKRWGASPPTFCKGLRGLRGRPDPKNHHFRTGFRTYKKSTIAGPGKHRNRRPAGSVVFFVWSCLTLCRQGACSDRRTHHQTRFAVSENRCRRQVVLRASGGPVVFVLMRSRRALTPRLTRRGR